MMNMERANNVAAIINDNNANLEAIAQEVRKGDDIIIGITVGEPDAKVKPNIYIDNMEDMTDEAIADKVLAIYEENKAPEGIGDFANDFLNWDKVKNNLMLCIRKRTSNEEDLTEGYLDMELYVRYILNGMSGGSVIIKKQFLEKWGVTLDEVFTKAKQNSKYVIDDMATTLQSLMSGEDLDDANIDFELLERKPMYILTNRSKLHGAAVISNTDFLNAMANKIEDDLYIIPSSIHECLAIPVNFTNMDTDYMREMIRDVNDTQVAPNEVLSYNLYYYDRSTNEVRVA